MRHEGKLVAHVLNASGVDADADEALDYMTINATAVELANVTAEMKNADKLAQSADETISSAAENISNTPLLSNATVDSTINAFGSNATATVDASRPKLGEHSFKSWYAAHKTGRGIWKWNNALHAYERHFMVWQGKPVSIAEVGVQSGGSISMWQSVLGSRCYVHGLDINKNCMKFRNARTSITIGDQADSSMWHRFFKQHPKVNLLVDDGGHEPHQMLTTTLEVFWKLQPGGSIAIEDIHGEHYVQSFFTPVANYFGHMNNKGKLDSVHVYPFLLIAQRAGWSTVPKTKLTFAPHNQAYVNSFAALWSAMGKHRGGVVILKNPKWGSFLSAQSLTSFFAHFAGLHSFNMYDSPSGCRSTAAVNCGTYVKNSHHQNLISGIHIYPNALYVEVTTAPPSIAAIRRGNQFIKYG